MILTLQGWLHYWDGLVPSSAFIPQVGTLQISSHFLTLSLEKETKNLLYLKSTLLCMLASKEIRTEQVCPLSLVSNLPFCELPYWIAEALPKFPTPLSLYASKYSIFFLYSRVPQPWHYWQFGLGVSLCGEGGCPIYCRMLSNTSGLYH